MKCPNCSSESYIKWGFKMLTRDRQKQQYQCKDCRRVFTEETDKMKCCVCGEPATKQLKPGGKMPMEYYCGDDAPPWAKEITEKVK